MVPQPAFSYVLTLHDFQMSLSSDSEPSPCSSASGALSEPVLVTLVSSVFDLASNVLIAHLLPSALSERALVHSHA